MELTEQGLNLIKRFEGFRSEAYQDSAGVWTVGYGTTQGVHPGMTVNRHEAEELLAKDIRWAEQAVNDLVTVPLGRHQFDALVSFVYNLGRGAFAGSTLLEIINTGQHALVARELTKWVYAGGAPLRGLARRRVAEADLYLQD
jgi:lysozyme